ncbi:MAG: helix-turn-helix transcriptional regulator, partial [Mogibacterium sp.]|nr:helix-turn-helix transcriptional regulator [Mogibacterium sp.]
LGSIADVSDKAVSTWENGVGEPRMGAVRRIADHFGISVSEILDSASANDPQSPDPKVVLLANDLQKDPELRKAVSLLQKRPELVDSLLRLNSLSPEEYELINSTMGRFRGSRRRK